MDNEKDSMSPEASPNTVEEKQKRARRLNNRPLAIVVTIGCLIAMTVGVVMLDRANRIKANVARNKGRAAVNLASEFMSPEEAGEVAPPAPEPEEEPEEDASDVPEDVPPDVPDEGVPPAPQVSEYDKRIRDMRLRQIEAAINGQIQVRLEDLQPKTGTLANEIASLEQQLAKLDGQSNGMTVYQAASDKWKNPGSVEAPATPFIIRTGSVIPATLQTEINSDLEGYITARVAVDVYDSPVGSHLLIPQNSRLFGKYESEIAYGQSRLFVVWNRIEFPDGKVLDIGEMPGTSGSGQSGFRDRVNHHFMRVFGSAILMSAIVAGVDMTQNNKSDGYGSNKQRMSDSLSEALGQNLGNVMVEMIRKNLNISPTIEIRSGYQFNVMLAKDLTFPGAYNAFDYARQ